MPAIKGEEGSEPPVASIAPKVSLDEPSQSSSAHYGRSTSKEHDDKPSLPPPPQATKPYIVARQAHLAPRAYHGSSPRKYKLAAPGNSGSRVNLPRPPVFSRLPSRLGPSIATGRVNKTTAAAATTTTTTTTSRTRTPNLPKIKHLTEHLKHKSAANKKIRSRMDDRIFEDDGEFMDGASFTGYPPMMINGKVKLLSSQREILIRSRSRRRRRCRVSYRAGGAPIQRPNAAARACDKRTER